jgi:hypothetical protein
MAVSSVSVFYKQGFSYRAESVGDLGEVTHETLNMGGKNLS